MGNPHEPIASQRNREMNRRTAVRRQEEEEARKPPAERDSDHGRSTEESKRQP